MAFDRHTLIGSALVGVIAIACTAGLLITGGPVEARKQKEDAARLTAIQKTAHALACYYQTNGNIPADLSGVEAEISDASSDTRKKKGCSSATYENDPISAEPFALRRDPSGVVTHICAVFETSDTMGRGVRLGRRVMPGINEARDKSGEHCFALNLDADLD